MPLITVVVPIYNVEKYIDKSIESILHQTLNNIEIILVDDGSTDKSGIIADFFAKKDNRVRVIHKKNQGVSEARNVGISMAKGEYVSFIDPDDWIDCNMFQELYFRAVQNNCDVVSCCFLWENIKDNKKLKECHPFTPYEVLFRDSIKKEIHGRLLTNGFFTSVCDKIYKRSFLEKYKIKMDVNMEIMEDYLFNMDVFNFARSVKYLPIPFYHYRVTVDSASRKYCKNLFEFNIRLYNKKKEYCKMWFQNDKKYLDRISVDFLIDVFHNLMQVYNKTNTSTIKNKWNKISNIISCSYVMQAIEQCKKYCNYKDRMEHIKIILIKNKCVVLLNILSIFNNNISYKSKVKIKKLFKKVK